MNIRLPALFLITATAALAQTKPAPELPPAKATEQWEPVPPVVSVSAGGVPEDAIVLFDGSNFDAWVSDSKKSSQPRWKLEDGVATPVPDTGSLVTKRAFGDAQLHLEFRMPVAAAKTGQHRGNSGVLFMGLYEFQVLDSYKNPTYANGQAASIYKQHAPLVNAGRAPGEWQTYDIVFVAPRFDAAGKLLSPARMTGFHNGVLVQHDAVLTGETLHRGFPAYKAHAAKLPLTLQNHSGDRPSFRNIWIREIALPEAAKK
ncbi:MAG: DUF1080 domain-containing protein [Opitutaceae bacterium]|jgi:hypothetical protein|nr:DUF1080 domain-containing protein [Opitutaceae bacterium]